MVTNGEEKAFEWILRRNICHMICGAYSVEVEAQGPHPCLRHAESKQRATRHSTVIGSLRDDAVYPIKGVTYALAFLRGFAHHPRKRNKFFYIDDTRTTLCPCRQ